MTSRRVFAKFVPTFAKIGKFQSTVIHRQFPKKSTKNVSFFSLVLSLTVQNKTFVYFAFLWIFVGNRVAEYLELAGNQW
jgi:hypothetical protein